MLPGSATTPRAFVRATAPTGVVLLALAAALGALIHARGPAPFTVDTWWNTLLVGIGSPVLLGFAEAMNFLGGGWWGVFVVPLLGAAAFVLWRRPWTALAFLAAEAGSAAVVQVMKHAFGRARPEEIIVISDFGSYPSGHTANAATLAVFLTLAIARWWVLAAGAAWVVLMALSRTLVHAHWISDTLGGAMIGAGAAFLVCAAFAVPLLRECRPRHPPEHRSRRTERR